LLFAAGALSSASACNSRFDFDATNAGSAGLAGAAMGGGGAPGTAGATAGTTAGTNTGGAGAAGAVSTGGTCGVHAQCPDGLHCVDGECDECGSDGDCKGASAARCDETHRCVACLATTDCPNGYTCDPIANRCLQNCREKSDCPSAAHGCDDDRFVCYQCDEDRECTSSALGPRCAPDGSGCVQCRGDADCAGKHCDTLTGRCVECRDHRDCASGLCDPTHGTCLEE
jgi:hypothetical protein